MRVLASLRGQAQVVADRDLVKRIRQCSEKDAEVTDALAKIQELGPRLLERGIEEWNVENGLLLFCGKVYVPTEPTL